MNIENKEFLTFELKPLISDCINYWLSKEYFDDDYDDIIDNCEIDELSEIDNCPDDLYETIYDAVKDILSDEEFDNEKLHKIVNKEWIIKRDDYVDKCYNYLERKSYINDIDDYN